MFDKYIKFGYGLQKNKCRLSNKIKALIKEEYINSKLRFNEQIVVKQQFNEIIIDTGRPHERFLVEFYDKYKDLLKDVDLSLNEIQLIIDEVEEEYSKTESKIQEIINKQTIKNRKELETKISSKEKKFLDTMYTRKGDILKMKDLIKDESEGIK